MAACCLPRACLQLLLQVSRGDRRSELAGRRGAATGRKGRRPSSAEDRSVLRTLPNEMLATIAVALPCATYKDCLAVSWTWHALLDHEVWWERLSQCQWPGVTRMTGSWRKFALYGGGDMLGKVLVSRLKAATVHCLTCPAGHVLRPCADRAHDLSCYVCESRSLPTHTTMWSCKTCNYCKCQHCFEAWQAPVALSDGAVNSSCDDGWTALHYSCRLGFAGVVQSLLNGRADVESADAMHGYTPLMVGATHGHRGVCSLLLSRGASKQTVNCYGRSALDCARAWGHPELEALLSWP